MSSHMFKFFINALNVQNEEIRSLHNKVTSLKKVNNEVLDFVYKSGRLPEIETNHDHEIFECLGVVSSLEDDSQVDHKSATDQYSGHRPKTIISKSLHSSVLENAVIKHTEELNRTLMFTNPVMIYERRRRELFRTNQRILLNPSYCSEDSTEHCVTKHITCHQSKSPSSVQLKSECQKIIPADSLLQFSDTNFMGLSNNSVSHFYVPEKSNANESSMNNCSINCPCGNRQNCPLSEQKIERLCKDPCVAHGFTILSAVFRGRFIRQLLATHKVCGLIRTVKDTAKLALSLRLERQSTIQQIRMPQCEFLSTNQPIQLSEQELLLESRLLTQLRSALNQIHEIFFQWPISNQILLISTSHSSLISQKSVKEIEHSPAIKPIISSSHNYTIDCSSTGYMVNRRKQSASIITDIQFKQNICRPTECKPIIRAKKQRIQSEDKCQLGSNSKIRTSVVSQFNTKKTESCRQPSASPTTHSIINSPEYKSEGKSNSHFVKSSSKRLSKLSSTPASKTHTLSSKSSSAAVTSKITNFSNSPNTGTAVSSSAGNSLMQIFGNSTKPIKPKIIRHFSKKFAENKSMVDSSTTNSELGTNSELETNFGTDLNNFSDLKTNNPDKCHVNYPILSQYENIVHAPSPIDGNNNNATGQVCFPVKRRILSRKLQNNDSNVFINLITQNNTSDYNKYSDIPVESFLVQDNQSINNTLCCNDDKVTNNHYDNSELRTTWTFDSKTQPSLIMDTTNLTN
ncbi:hypothetical protein MN116_000756 [Schistosoma mekongi]|uniref:Rac guanyl-nucleotide exchange factor n=1 Tax=Schistosoma mekongi TaxID=38744 RepID=A0AAE2D8C5_SCHME|nr:hypothetical protein MN116_000756 [Schistosoma mekongi]